MATMESPPVPMPASVGREIAQGCGLRYVSDAKPGLSRERKGDAFVYRDPSGRRITDPETLRRIKSLVIPPAWTSVWICPLENGHLQATGRDARGRKQYRYHPTWRQVRDDSKFGRMLHFGRSLPSIRQKIQRHLAASELSRDKVLAAVVSLLEKSLIRVGNDEYASSNGSYGLTTMQDRHVSISRGIIEFRFRGKSGVKHRIAVRDRRLARIVKRCQDLPGQELFQYRDDGGTVRDVTSGDVNEFLRRLSGYDFTAKDFRTWAGTVLAAMALQELKEFDSQAQAKRNIRQAIERVAKCLGNTPTVCRKCYVHPAVVDAYIDRSMLETAQQTARQEIVSALSTHSPEEALVLGLLERRLSRQAA